MTGTDRRRLLMVDDEAQMGSFVARVAEGMNYAVECFTEANGFLAALDQGDPDVILLDLTMPGTDGFELLGKLSQKGSRARIFVMSGFDPGHQRMALTLGEAKGLTMSGLIPKPVRAAELRKLLA
jgi:DNA-binding response OmpR family regulator